MDTESEDDMFLVEQVKIACLKTTEMLLQAATTEVDSTTQKRRKTERRKTERKKTEGERLLNMFAAWRK